VKFLTGKAKTSYTPHVDAGDYVVAINADKIVVTGRKLEEKLYHWHTGHPQGFRTRTFKELTKQDPRRTIKYAVAGMLPKNKLRPMRMSRLKIFPGGEHPYQDKIKERPASE
jgi:large subunit ribosomal protein L13